ncbi:hypothetical protein D9757_004577, partial [Collybiopsis confluens]
SQIDYSERRNVRVIQQSADASHNPYLLSEAEEKTALKKHQDNKARLRVPRRPAWTKSKTPAELDRQEKAAFLEWRRELARLQEEDNFLLTPFERNLEVWRQLWRVLERSQLIVQIVDARNPLRFRCEDLEDYVADVEGPEGEKGTGKGMRRSLLLINKADLLTSKQRFEPLQAYVAVLAHGIQYAFFSAAQATAIQEARQAALLRAQERVIATKGTEGEQDDPSDSSELEGVSDLDNSYMSSSDDNVSYFSADEADIKELDPRCRVLSVLQLEELFERKAPDLSAFTDPFGKSSPKLTVGLVGYPNVGKSSTINALLGDKKVSVSSTPGKTKHFQTIHLSDSIVLCDCPGLVFPQFATTKAELVCDGVLPIDQMKEYTGPISLVVQRIPKKVLEATYGLLMTAKGIEEGGNGQISAENLLIAYAIARGYTRSGQGNPDEARAARYILKDYVNAKLLFCHPPPQIPEKEFNSETHGLSLQRVAGKKNAPLTRVSKNADTFVPSALPTAPSMLPALGQGHKSRALDHEFFEEKALSSGAVYAKGVVYEGKPFSRGTAFPHQHSVTNIGTVIEPKFARIASVLANNDRELSSKKHKKPKRVKQRSGRGYD